MKRTTLRLFALVFFNVLSISSKIFAQMAPAVLSQKCFGGTMNETPASIIRTSDGGYTIAGSSNSSNGDVAGNYGGEDIWIVKLDSALKIVWQKNYGGSGDDVATSIIQTFDGGYAFAGYTNSSDTTVGDVKGLHGRINAWIGRLDSIGNIKWQKCIGGSDQDYAWSIIQSSDSNFVIAGQTNSIDGDLSGLRKTSNNTDAWVIKLTDSGSVAWSMSYGGTSNDGASSIVQTYEDNGYIFAGYAHSIDGDVSGNHGGDDLWLVKLNSSGRILWQKCSGGSGNDGAQSIIQASDGGFVIAGRTESNDGDVSGNHGVPGPNPDDGWITKYDASGNLLWQKCLGGNNLDDLYSVIQSSDHGYVVIGSTLSTDLPEGVFYQGGSDVYVAKLNSSGDLLWQQCYGGKGLDAGNSLVESSRGELILACHSNSKDGDVFGNHGSQDIWVVKLAQSENDVAIIDNKRIQVQLYPNPSSDQLHLQLPGMQSFRQLEFYDILGKKLSLPCLLESNSATIDVHSLMPATYYARVSYLNNGVEGIYEMPIVVQH